MDLSHRLGRVRPLPQRSSVSILLSAVLLSAFSQAPGHASMQYSLSEETKSALNEAPQVQDQILGSLEMLFGSPQHPSYLRTKEWIDGEFDPNHAEAAADAGGTGELTEGETAAVKDDNKVRFREQLEKVSRRDYAGLASFKSAPHLSEKVAAIVGDK